MSDASILALLPFRVRGALSLRVLREMRTRGMDVAVAYLATPPTLALDAAIDLEAEGRLVDLSRCVTGAELAAALDREIAARRVGLVLQVGAEPLYRELPYLRERHRGLRLLDTLYNDVGHVVNHFLYERCFDGVVVESLAMRSYVERCSSNPRLDVRVVENGIDLGAFRPAPRERGQGIVLGYVGRMSREKNPIGFVELCERLHGLVPGLSFRMVGDGPLAAEVRQRVAASPARAAFSLAGHRDDVPAALNELDVLLVPSRLDGRPNAIMEANACGVPVLAAPVGGIPELVEDGRNGYLFAPADVARHAELLRAWSASPEALAEIKASSRALAEARFDQRRMFDRYEAVFREHLANPKLTQRRGTR